jgi:hypothetical protein
VLEEGEVSAQIPVFLRDAVQQLQEYFNLKELILPLNSIQRN